MGRGAAEEGAEIVYQGPPTGLADCESSVTGAYLAGRRSIGVPSKRRARNHGTIRLLGARLHNLQDLSVVFPLNVLCVVPVVSAAVNSSLAHPPLYPAPARRTNRKLRPG